MNKLIYSLKRVFRMKRSSALLVILTFTLSCAVFFSSVILETCKKSREEIENPYSSYYRLMCDEFGYSEVKDYYSEDDKNIIENRGYADKHLMKSAPHATVNTINEYFLDITDSYMEILENTRSEKILPIVPEDWEFDDFFLFHAVPNAEHLTSFLYGEKVLVDGRYINGEDNDSKSFVCMISDVLAEKNGIKVGDTVDFYDPATVDTTGYRGKYVNYTVVGIYHDYKVQETDIDDLWTSTDIIGNRVYIPLSLIDSKTYNLCYNYQIKLSNDDFASEMEDIINKYRLVQGKAYLVKVENIFSSNNREVAALQTIFTIVQYSVIVLSSLFMVLYIYSMITSRKRECGVLLGLGQSKIEVFSGILIECCICVLLGVTLASVFTSIIGDDVAKIIYEFVNQNNSAEAIGITTSDAVAHIVKEKAKLMQMFDASFVKDCIFSGGILLIPVILLGFTSAALGISKINVMTLLSKEEA